MNKKDLPALVKIMEMLRGEKGCPWDKDQTRTSLKPYIIEEAYELIESIEDDDPDRIREELGDLLFQIVFQCQLAKENNEFTIDDVIEKISTKMIERHPHVFGKAHYKTADEVIVHWEEQKKLEGKLRESILEGVPESMPSLLRANRLQSRAAQVGFDWEKVEDVMGKLDEELKELKDAIKTAQREKMEEELGDILFVLVNVSRFLNVNAEDALRKTIRKFISRFQYIEIHAAHQGKKLSDMTLEEMDSLWDKAKERD
jgi:tetrapyrrole methylase family protein/MazG family protein